MRIIGSYLIFGAVALRSIVLLTGEPMLSLAVALLAVYAIFLLAEPWFLPPKIVRFSPAANSEDSLSHAWLPIVYLLVQSCIVTILLLIPPKEDFFALLFIPLSLQAVLFYGRRLGFLLIAAFSLAMAGALLASEEGRVFGLAMTLLYSGICFLFGGYAHQVHKAEMARSRNRRMLGQLQLAHQKLQGYATQVEDLAAEQERNRLARELHDSVTQTMFSMNLAVQSARLLLEKEPGRVAGQLERVEEMAAGAMREIQNMISQLRPRSVAEEGLLAALRRLATERKVRDGLEVTLEVSGEQALPEAVTVGLYNIVQEALNNVAKHAGTQQATVRLNLLESGGCLEIEDCGRGFDPQAALSLRDHLGLVAMGERAQELGWNLNIESHPGRGTRVRVEKYPAGGGE